MDFAAKYGEVQMPRHDEAWSMISSGVGAAEQHRQCTQGKHDFDFCPDIMEHTCFFCLYIDGQSSDNDDPEVPQPMLRRRRGRRERVSPHPMMTAMKKHRQGFGVRIFSSELQAKRLK